MDQRRSFVKAKRRCAGTQVQNSERHLHQTIPNRTVQQQSPKRLRKNIASERMAKLRESLAEEVIHKSPSSPPAKRPRRDTANYYQDHSYTNNNSTFSRTSFKTPPKVTAGNTAKKQSPQNSNSCSVQNRLKAVGTPSTSYYSKSPAFPNESALSPKETNVQFQNVSLNSSTASLTTHANCSDQNITEEDMEWSPVTEESLLSNIRIVREKLHEESLSNHVSSTISFSQIIENADNRIAWKKKDSSHIYIVVDTNIFIDKLQTLQNIMSLTYADKSFPIIYVPWMVLQELDYFKDGYSLSERHPVSKVIQSRCRKAVKFINDCLSSFKPNFKGQNVLRASEDRIKFQNPDDSIIACCNQLINEGFDVILLSSDVNLRNKAIICSINSHTPNDILQVLKLKKQCYVSKNIAGEVAKKMSLILSYMMHLEFKSIFTERTFQRNNFKELPWSFSDCITYLKGFYDEVFGTRLQKQCRKVLNDLLEMVQSQDFTNEMKFVELCLSLLIYFQSGIPKYESNIQKIIVEIKQLERGT